MFKFKSRLIAELVVVLVLIAIGLLINVYVSDSDISNTFQKLSTYSYDDKALTFNLLIIGTIGCYYYLISSAFSNFKNIFKLFLLLAFGLMTLFSSLNLMVIIGEITDVITSDFNSIPFPTEPDIVQKNVRLNVLNSMDFFNLSLIISGGISILISGYYLLLIKKEKR